MKLTEEQINTIASATLYGLMRAEGLSQAELATRSGIPRVTVQKLLAGKQSIKLHQFLHITHGLGVSSKDAMAQIEMAVETRSKAMSAGIRSLDDLRAKKQQQAREMTPEQLDAILEKAGINDPELEQDEPDTP